LKFIKVCSEIHVFVSTYFERNEADWVDTCIGELNKRNYTMKKMMSIAAVTLMIAGSTAFAQDASQCSAKKAECKKADSSACSAQKDSAECAKKADAKKCAAGCSKKADA
jgi:hypothetical protein